MNQLLTEYEIKERLKRIKEVADDDEEAHSLQEDLLADFIKGIALRPDYDGELARLVLTVLDIEFSRWYA